MVLIPSSVTLIRMMLSIIGLWAFLPDKGRTTIYQCKDAAGTTVFTDSPAQLTQCVSFERKTPEPETENPRSSPSQISDEPLPHQKTPQDPAFLDPYAPPPDEFDRHPSAPSADAFQQKLYTETPPREESAPAALHLTRIDNAMVVQVLINRRQHVHLIVDTEASMTVLSHNLAAELGLLSSPEVSLGTLNTAGGTIQATTTNVQEIRAGSAIAHNVPVAVYDLPNLIPGISGILGTSFLNNFKVTFDPEHALLHLDPHQ